MKEFETDRETGKLFAKKSPANANILMLVFTFWTLFISILSVSLLYFGVLAIPISVLAAIGQVVGLFGGFVLFLLISKQKPRDVLMLKAPSGRNTILAILMGIAFVPIIITISIAIPILTSAIFPVEEVVATAFAQEVPSLWVLLVIGAVFPAIFEEITYRGILFNQYGVGKNGVSISRVAFFTSLIFALAHGNTVQILYALPFGMLFTYILYYTRSIWMPIIIHFVTNALAFILAFMQPPPEVTDTYVQADALPSVWPMILLFGAISLVLSPIIIFSMRKFKKDYNNTQPPPQEIEGQSEYTTKPKYFTWALWLNIIILLVLTLLRDFGILFQM